jgi:DNA invertase Pin-like site-specific DNA recombinase
MYEVNIVVSIRKIGYARVSMYNQDLALQFDALKAAGVIEGDIFVEKISGKLSQSKRPQLQACLHSLKSGDCLIVWKLDRLGRSLRDLINIIQELEERKIRFSSLTETIDTSTPTGRLMFHMIAAFGEFERNLIKERSTAGLTAARERGRIGGRRYKLSQAQQKRLIGLYCADVPIRNIQEQIGISKPCIYSYLRIHDISLRNSHDNNI